ncbi:MAG: hypothetical protein KDB95_15025 [Flavobacteriales bacterium]|nr:hypothetical protein [Flavobacteriales bacterium]HPF91362.1 hypothetical protein [Flavobacteriales bacterium]
MKAATAIALMLMVLTSTTSFRLSKHRCGGHVVSWSLAGDAEPCAHARAMTCPMHAEAPMRGCCSDETQLLQGLPLNVVPGAVLQLPVHVAPLLAVLDGTPDLFPQPVHRDVGPTHGKAPPLRGWEIHIRERSILI